MSTLNNINTRNYSQKTNYMCGTESMDLLPFYVTTLNIPGINTNVQEISGRSGAPVQMTPGNMTFNSLSLEVLLDEDYKIYRDIIKNIKIDVETGTFESAYFDFWTSFTNDMGKVVMKIEYYNCLIESIGDLSLATNDDTTEQTFDLSLKFDYFKIVDNETPILRH